MATSLSIPKNPVYPRSMDWTSLRREGVQHIERLGSAIWTDYNLHDPGITVLEILCYAITDVGYRANLPAPDLFAGGTGKPFFTAAEILPCHPVTALDVRKILIDIPGVRNAWVEQRADPEVRFKLRATYSGENGINAKIQDFLNSKYQEVLGEPVVMDLNSPLFEVADVLDLIIRTKKCDDERTKREASEELKRTLLYKVLEQISDNDDDPLKKALLWYTAQYHLPEAAYFIEQEIRKGNLPPETEERVILRELRRLSSLAIDGSFDYPWDKHVIYDEADNFTLIKLIGQNDDVAKFLYAYPLLCLILQNSLEHSEVSDTESANYYNLFIPQGIYTVSLDLEDEAEVETSSIRAEALKRLHTYRNLGEDIDPDIRIIEKIAVGLRLNLEVSRDADEWEVLARVYEAVRNYLSPSLRFYSLEEMLNKYGSFTLSSASLEQLQEAMIPDDVLTALRKIQDNEYIGVDAFRAVISQSISSDHFDEHYHHIFVHAQKHYDTHPVYQGPLLKHGFLNEDELMNAQPRQTIYKSDLYQVITAVEGVKQINTLKMFRCAERDKEDDWCLSFDCRCLPELDLACSSFTVSKNGFDLPMPTESLKDYLEAHPLANNKMIREANLDLPVPKGRTLSGLTDYTSIQEDFPRTYKIGRTGIGNASKEPDLRKAQTKQLKGYLLFYDQILANYLAHLESVRSLLSIEKTESPAYQPLYHVPGVQELLLDYEPDDNWETFKDDPNNQYVQMLKRLTEGNETEKNIRESNVLDYLLARFGEEFSDYVLKLYQIEQSVESKDLWEENSSLENALTDKQRFLDHLPVLGSQRARGFNYHVTKGTEADFWNSDNVSGLKRRVCAKLGIEDWTRHTITCEPAFAVEVAPVRNLKGTKNKYEFYVKRDETSPTRLLISTAQFSTSEAAEQASADFLNLATDIANYGIIEDRIGFWAGTTEGKRTKENAVLLGPRDDSGDLNRKLEEIRDLANAHCQDDSFHIIEHVLLRPRNETFTESGLLRPMVCCPDRLELLDPYSFWISVIVPEWVTRFKHPVQRRVFEQTLRAEAPAHLAIRFCVLDRDRMLAFEKAYYDWLKALCSERQENLANATNDLTSIMNSWDDTVVHY